MLRNTKIRHGEVSAQIRIPHVEEIYDAGGRIYMNLNVARYLGTGLMGLPEGCIIALE